MDLPKSTEMTSLIAASELWGGGKDLEAKIAKAKKTWAVAGLQGEDTMAEKQCKWSPFTHLTTLWRGGAPLQQ